MDGLRLGLTTNLFKAAEGWEVQWLTGGGGAG